MKPLLALIIAFGILPCFSACDECRHGANFSATVERSTSHDHPSTTEQEASEVKEIRKIKITVGDQVITATLDDNATAKDFAALLPMTLKLGDYNRTEKVSGLSEKLSTEGAPSGHTPSIGDICLYAPWSNLCIFYKKFSYSSGLVKFGKIEGGVKAFDVSGSVEVKIEAAE